ncbi:hypothetical protein F5880DRAFT_1611775 [Lentinula raphanica]|nr:hypothetical protein F5880DRAFT_1611775 [Lentinula raphanica]
MNPHPRTPNPRSWSSTFPPDNPNIHLPSMGTFYSAQRQLWSSNFRFPDDFTSQDSSLPLPHISSLLPDFHNIQSSSPFKFNENSHDDYQFSSIHNQADVKPSNSAFPDYNIFKSDSPFTQTQAHINNFRTTPRDDFELPKVQPQDSHVSSNGIPSKSSKRSAPAEKRKGRGDRLNPGAGPYSSRMSVSGIDPDDFPNDTPLPSLHSTLTRPTRPSRQTYIINLTSSPLAGPSTAPTQVEVDVDVKPLAAKTSDSDDEFQPCKPPRKRRKISTSQGSVDVLIEEMRKHDTREAEHMAVSHALTKDVIRAVEDATAAQREGSHDLMNILSQLLLQK